METLSLKNMLDEIFAGLLSFTEDAELIVPVLNEIFGTNYPLDVPLEQLRNEHQTLNGEKITDSYFRIGKKVIISNARVQVTRKW